MSFKTYEHSDKLEDEAGIRRKYLNLYGGLDIDYLEENADTYSNQDWIYISYFAELTITFINDFSEDIHMSLVFENNYTSDYVKAYFIDDYDIVGRRGYQIEPVKAEQFNTVENYIEEVRVRLKRGPRFTLVDEYVKK